MEPGDVVIVLQQKDHDVFSREGDNLFLQHKISLTEALCGFEFTVKQLDGRELVIKHPAGTVIEPGLDKFNNFFLLRNNELYLVLYQWMKYEINHGWVVQVNC